MTKSERHPSASIMMPPSASPIAGAVMPTRLNHPRARAFFTGEVAEHHRHAVGHRDRGTDAGTGACRDERSRALRECGAAGAERENCDTDEIHPSAASNVAE